MSGVGIFSGLLSGGLLSRVLLSIHLVSHARWNHSAASPTGFVPGFVFCRKFIDKIEENHISRPYQKSPHNEAYALNIKASAAQGKAKPCVKAKRPRAESWPCGQSQSLTSLCASHVRVSA